MSRSNGKQPIYPYAEVQKYDSGIQSQTTWHQGLTKREYLAALALQGLLANPEADPADPFTTTAITLADSLLAALEDES